MSKSNRKRCLRVCWGKPEGEPVGSRDIIYHYPTQKCDAALLHHAFTNSIGDGKSLLDELVDRGFDLSTLKFSIQLKDEDGIL